jgi:hypothetical protein
MPFAFIVALALASVSATPLVAAEMPTTQADCRSSVISFERGGLGSSLAWRRTLAIPLANGAEAGRSLRDQL